MFKHLLILTVIVSIVRILYILSGHIDLSPEEAQYWLWSKYLDLSYYSKPPLIAYMNYISTSILGDTELGVRINAVLLGAFVPIITFFISKEVLQRYFSSEEDLEKFSFLSALFVYGTVGYNLASVLFLTDTPLLFFFVLTLLFMWKALEEDKPLYWILTGLSAGLGFLAKYSMALILPPALLYVFLFKREALKNKWLYISILIASIFTIPVLYWNYKHDWVSFKHVSTLEGSQVKEISLDKSLQYMGDYIAGQIAILSIFLFPLMLYALYKAIRDIKRREIFYLFIFPIFVFLVFLYISHKKRVYANWPAFAYITISILTAFYTYKKRLFKTFAVLFALSVLSIVVLFYTPILDKVGLTKLLPPKKDPTKKLVGWEELGKEASNVIKSLNTNKYFVFSETYQVASEMAFYIEPKPIDRIFCINISRRMNQFDLWKDINIYSNKGYYGIYITLAKRPHKQVLEAFEKYLFKKEHKIIYRGEVIYTYYIHVLKGFKKFKNAKTDRY